MHVKSVVTESADNVYTQHFYFTTSEKLFREPTVFTFKRDEKIAYGGLYIADTIFNKTPIWENQQQRWRFGTICGHGANYIYRTLILDLNEVSTLLETGALFISRVAKKVDLESNNRYRSSDIVDTKTLETVTNSLVRPGFHIKSGAIIANASK